MEKFSTPLPYYKYLRLIELKDRESEYLSLNSERCLKCI